MDEELARVFLPPRERCFERLRLACFGETVTCVHCGDDAVVNRGTTGKDAQQYWCKECKTYFNDFTNTIFGQHRFRLEEMFYIVASCPLYRLQYEQVRRNRPDVRRDQSVTRMEGSSLTQLGKIV